jgi:hypothetical protein
MGGSRVTKAIKPQRHPSIFSLVIIMCDSWLVHVRASTDLRHSHPSLPEYGILYSHMVYPDTEFSLVHTIGTDDTHTAFRAQLWKQFNFIF